MALYLITGGAGFIGSNLTKALIAQGQQVRILDNLSTGRPVNLLGTVDNVQMIEGDLRDYHTVSEVVKGVDYVLHQGALPSVPRSVGDPITSNAVNVTGTLNLLHAAMNAGVKRLTFASSSSVYGNSAALPKVETMPTNPLSPYAVSKLAAEQYCQTFHRLYGFETVCLRYFNVFGPQQDPASQYSAVIPRFIKALLTQEPITIYGDGSQSRDFTFIDNVVHGNLLACTAANAAGQVLNVACAGRHTLLDLVALLEEFTGVKAQIIFANQRAGDVLHSEADISKAKTVLGYEPVVSFRAGIEQTVRWYQAQMKGLSQ